MGIPWAEVRNSKFQIPNCQKRTKKQDLAFGIPNSELLPLESPWQFHKQKFGIWNSIALFDLFAQKSQKGIWNSEFRTSAHGIAMTIPRAEVRNLEFYWNSEFRTSAHGSLESASPWTEV